MSSDTPLKASLLDGDVFPISIGLQASTGDQTTTEQNTDQPAAADISDEQSVLAVEPDATDNKDVLSGYDLVADMMRRQDEVLGQLDDLNDRIELAIDQISATRKSEIEALNAESDQTESDDYLPVQKKAA